MTSRIAVLGPTLQNIYFEGRELQVGEKNTVDKMVAEISGAGLSAAITLARRGHEVVLLSPIGKDATGQAALSVLDHEGIDSSYVQFYGGNGTGTNVIWLDKKTEQDTTVFYHGISEKFDKFDASDLELLQPDYLYATSTGGNMEKLLEFFEKAHEVDAKVVFHPGDAEIAENKKMLGLLSETDVLILNKKQAAELVPGNILSELLYHLNGYAPITIITDGAMGGIAGDVMNKEIYRFGIYEDVRVKDRTGAGNAFAAGFVAAKASGKSFRQSLVFASANATAVIQKIGSRTGILTGRDELHPMPMQKLN